LRIMAGLDSIIRGSAFAANSIDNNLLDLSQPG
jgi:hypothetical protein